jgi:glycosyltransferase involved in cell wall biosynthesis
VPSLAIEVIKHGLRYGNLRQNKKRYNKEDVITFCYCGSFNEHKGVHILIDAVKKIKSDRVRLKIYGSGDPVYTSRLKEMASGDRRIEFCGVYSDVQAADVYTSVDVIVVPSLWYETYGLVLREAFLCSVPVLASNVGVMSEAVRDGVNGFVFRIGDPEHLREVIEKILGDPEMLNRIKAGTKYDFVPTIEHEAYAYNRVYRDVLSADAIQHQCSPTFSSGEGS